MKLGALRRAPVLGAVLIGLAAGAIYRQGAFYPFDAVAVAVISSALVVICISGGVDHTSWAVAASAIAFAVWWFVTAVIHGRMDSFLPLGASALAFLATFLVIRGLPSSVRAWMVAAYAALGAGFGVVSLVAVAIRWYPQAIPSQDLWRAATSLTYANAAGALFAMALLVALGQNLSRRLPRLVVGVLVTSLLATQCRGAILALLVAVLLVPVRQLRTAVRPGLAGMVAGVAVVATSKGAAARPLSLLVVAAMIVFTLLVPPRSSPLPISPWRWAALVLVGSGLIIAAGLALAVPLHLRLELGSSIDREYEWRAALLQWRQAPVTGVGPDVLLHLPKPKGGYDHFAHDEYLQVLAGGGIIGAVLLTGCIGSVVAVVRRVDVVSSCATAALLAFALVGLVDFVWHLPALAVLAGWAAGMAGRPAPLREDQEDRGQLLPANSVADHLND